LPFFEETTVPSISSLKDVFAVSDLIIARAGSGLIFEIAASGKPSILIPLPWASRGHQKKMLINMLKTKQLLLLKKVI